ncbi:universal stress protein [Nocardioides sp. T2.26MG-1]|uniref:universal stress protein n=1 Tax=Nocardioides sp. T2.26MG-1 TaxID=3041166 RepID=UPI0024774C77|nr:universal stress protein [Nocardioides sp. T2.26MG-1]CAI9407589.1 Universal stress protein [Nocardioides sp. T2.26MG-1]
MHTTPAPIVVAVGSKGSLAAIDFAATEALRQHRGLHLVHGLDVGPAVSSVIGVDLALLEEEAGEVLSAAVRHAVAVVGGLVPVTSSLSQVPAVAAVYASAHDAPLVVVGRCARSRLTHPYVRTVTGGVAARVHVPVVSVPDDWDAGEAPAHVVVGVDHPQQSVPVLHEAFQAAGDRKALLTVVSSWWDPTAYVHDPAAFERDPTWPERLRAGIDEVLPDLRAEYPDVPVELHVRKSRPGEVLIDASRHACLLVLGRHDPVLPRDSHLGPIARSVLAAAACPVLLTTPRRPSGIRRAIHLDPQPA